MLSVFQLDALIGVMLAVSIAVGEEGWEDVDQVVWFQVAKCLVFLLLSS